MSQACPAASDAGAARREGAALKAASGLALAASPTFAVMAFLTSLSDSGSGAMVCSAADASPLSGMAMMYLLMSAFHVAPWLRLMRGGARWPV